ncbi:MAG TPA: hypothetical protein VFW03_09005 [Gemmatimonadaceae bacterium]|nr:hypothetical protein [Gemmatimonadaceae bacterium]
MSADLPFKPAHVSAIATRASELERIGEETQDPDALVRAARLYTLAVRIVDDIELREALPFMHSDLARVRDELRTLASERIANRTPDAPDPGDSAGTITRLFREIAVRIEQRLERRNEPAQPA